MYNIYIYIYMYVYILHIHILYIYIYIYIYIYTNLASLVSIVQQISLLFIIISLLFVIHYSLLFIISLFLSQSIQVESSVLNQKSLINLFKFLLTLNKKRIESIENL